jgi:hypothetical protein
MTMSTPLPAETPSGLPNTGGLPGGTPSNNWLLALLGFSILMIGSASACGHRLAGGT